MRGTCLFFIILTLFSALGCGRSEQPLVTPNGAWRKQGTIMTGRAEEEYAVQEPSVLYEDGLFEMWYTCGWNIEGMCYATSPDGMNWTRHKNGMQLINNVAHGFVIKVGSTYYY